MNTILHRGIKKALDKNLGPLTDAEIEIAKNQKQKINRIEGKIRRLTKVLGKKRNECLHPVWEEDSSASTSYHFIRCIICGKTDTY